MGLSITVQKGHDFSSGNVTRAALNAGATPTIGSGVEGVTRSDFDASSVLSTLDEYRSISVTSEVFF